MLHFLTNKTSEISEKILAQCILFLIYFSSNNIPNSTALANDEDFSKILQFLLKNVSFYHPGNPPPPADPP